jgi:hypothetical protein
VMANIKFYLVTYDKCENRAVSLLSKEEREKVYCYAVNSVVPKLITAKIKIINEWQLPWYSSRYQTLKYFEYGMIPHCVKNPTLTDGLSHIGFLPYDVLFGENSINDMIKKLETESNTIFYVTHRKDALYFTREQLSYITDYLSPKLGVVFDPNKIWNDGWISEALSVTPIDVFKKFGEFLLKYQYDMENMLSTNRWGLMSTTTHRLCGLTERFWGMYLVSCGLPLERMNVEHDHDYYTSHA